jgi:hypothetical protein
MERPTFAFLTPLARRRRCHRIASGVSQSEALLAPTKDNFMTTWRITRTLGLLVAITLTFGSLVRGENPPSNEAGKPQSLSADKLTGKWKGEKDGIKVTLKFKGDKTYWAVEQPLAPNGKEQIKADYIKLVNDEKSGGVDLKKGVKAIDEQGNATGEEKLLHLGKLQGSANDTLTLTIFHVQNYHAVDGLVLHWVAGPKKPAGIFNLSEPQATTCDVLSDLSLEQLPSDSNKRDAPPKFTVTKETLEFLKKYEGKTIEVSDDGSLEIEEH